MSGLAAAAAAAATECATSSASPAASSSASAPHRLRVIFLDVDGVLCLNEFATLQPELLNNLAYACAAAGACVAVSSDWRLFPSKFSELCRALRRRNIRVIGKTGPSAREDARPREIAHFLTSFHARMKRQGKPWRVQRWVAVDDRQLDQEEGGERMTARRFVKTDPAKGFNLETAMRVIAAFGGRCGSVDGDEAPS